MNHEWCQKFPEKAALARLRKVMRMSNSESEILIIKRRDRRLQREYGITLDDFHNLIKAQKGKCALCGRKRRLVVDHCHKTGKMRGLVCIFCNRYVISLFDYLGLNAGIRAVTRYLS